MKNKNVFKLALYLIGICMLFLILITTFFERNKVKNIEIKNVNSEEVIRLINKKSGERFLYIGRESCKWCKDFEISLEKVKTNKTIFYFDADKVNDEELREVKKAIGNLKLGINTVPALIKLKNNEKNNFEISNDIKDIEKFLNQ